VIVELIEVVEASKTDAQTLETCLSRLRSDEKITPSTRTLSDAVTVSESICRGKPLLPSDDWLYFEPAQSGTILRRSKEHVYSSKDNTTNGRQTMYSRARRDRK